MTEETQEQTTDRLSFMLFLAAAIHGVIILGIWFPDNPSSKVAPALNITLASHNAKKAPDKADFIAQYNQEASGTLDEVKELTTNSTADFADVQINQVNPAPKKQASQKQDKQARVITTKQKNHHTAPDKPSKDSLLEQEDRIGEDRAVNATSEEFASLQARLDIERQAYANKPRIRRHTSVSTKEHYEAVYLNHLTQKIEAIGRENFPKEALKRRLSGAVRILIQINPNGTVDHVQVLQSSGQRLFDDAAIQTIKMSAPFDAFPPKLTKIADKLELIRTLKFEITGRFSSE